MSAAFKNELNKRQLRILYFFEDLLGFESFSQIEHKAKQLYPNLALEDAVETFYQEYLEKAREEASIKRAEFYSNEEYSSALDEIIGLQFC